MLLLCLQFFVLWEESHIFVFASFAVQYNRREAKSREIQKRTEEIPRTLEDDEWRVLVKGLNEFRKQIINDDGPVEVINELLIKIIDTPTKKIKVMEVSR